MGGSSAHCIAQGPNSSARGSLARHFNALSSFTPPPPRRLPSRWALWLVLAGAQVDQKLVCLYRQIGEYISRNIESATWGEGAVEKLAAHIARKHADPRGFTRPNLFRMRQFHAMYLDDPKVAPLVRELPWTHNLLILSRSKRPEEREFSLRMALRERWSKRERQLNGALIGRVVLSLAKSLTAGETIARGRHLGVQGPPAIAGTSEAGGVRRIGCAG